MSNSWLSQLAPEYAPAAPGWWPLALGWWLVVVVSVLLVAISVWWWRYSFWASRRRPQRIAMREFLRIRESIKDTNVLARALENLMRRYALAVFGHDAVARMSGNAWLNFVAAHGGEQIAGDAGHALLAAAFGNATHDQREQWLAAAEAFIQRADKILKPQDVSS